jgi:hypothetical protein
MDGNRPLLLWGWGKFIAMLFESSLDGGGQIHQQMESVGDLDRVCRTLLSRFSIDAAAIAADNLYAWMAL